MKVNVHNKFVIPNTQRTFVGVHKDTHKKVKKYAWTHGLSIAEAVERLLQESLNKSKTS